MLRLAAAALLASSSTAAAVGINDAPVPPLRVYYRATLHDNAVVATAASAASLPPSFVYYADNLFVLSNASTPPPAPPATVALNFYAHPTTGHHITTASAQGNALAVAAGFVLQRIEGWVVPVGSEGADDLPLVMWYSSARDDHFLVGTAQNEANARGAGYVPLFTDCYVPRPPPEWVVWPDAPPDGMPFPQSSDLTGFEYNANGNAQPPGIAADTWCA